jgi:predicted ribosomally synthesized peptide with SipW-like signal peptide
MKKQQFELSIDKLEPRHEEQSALAALLAVAGTTAAFSAQAWSGDPSSAPSCSIFEW